MNGAELNEPEPPPETPPGEEGGESVEELEDRLITALERNEQLEQRIATLESRLGAIESNNHRTEPIPESPPVDPAPTNRQPDQAPRPAHVWYRKLNE